MWHDKILRLEKYFSTFYREKYCSLHFYQQLVQVATSNLSIYFGNMKWNVLNSFLRSVNKSKQKKQQISVA